MVCGPELIPPAMELDVISTNVMTRYTSFGLLYLSGLTKNKYS